MPIPENNPIVVAPSPTPFKPDDSVDHDAIEKNVAKWLDTPLSGFVLNSENGEEQFLSEYERLDVVRTVNNARSGQKFIIGGVDSSSVTDSIRTAEALVEAATRIPAGTAKAARFSSATPCGSSCLRLYADAMPVRAPAAPPGSLRGHRPEAGHRSPPHWQRDRLFARWPCTSKARASQTSMSTRCTAILARLLPDYVRGDEAARDGAAIADHRDELEEVLELEPVVQGESKAVGPVEEGETDQEKGSDLGKRVQHHLRDRRVTRPLDPPEGRIDEPRLRLAVHDSKVALGTKT